MSTRADHLSALSRICRQLGGRLAVVSQPEFDDVFDPRVDHTCGGEERSEAPFTDAHGLWWRKKIIYAVHGRENVNGIIHEMGHVFASAHHPDCSCGKCHEWNWFGWEIVLARQIDAVRTWSYHTWRALTRADLPRGSIAALEMQALRICKRCEKLGRISSQGVIHVVESA